MILKKKKGSKRKSNDPGISDYFLSYCIQL